MRQNMVPFRSSGILLHITSLPGKFGIGDIGPQAHAFLDWLEMAGQSWWQVLPLGPTAYGNSPYSGVSTFAGNPNLVSPELLFEDGLLEKKDIDDCMTESGQYVNFHHVFTARRELVGLAALNFLDNMDTEAREKLENFKNRNSFWLRDYTLFIDIKKHFDSEALKQNAANSSWNKYWPEALKARGIEALKEWEDRRSRELEILAIEQYFFFTQWAGIRQKAKEKGIGIIGDVPIFVAMDGSDTWASPWLFDLDDEFQPREISGVPPDYFSEDGQLWGNPLYNWEQHKADNFAWWHSRISSALDLYDLVRVDHFRGLEAYYAVPGGAENARHGQWKKAPGKDFLTSLRSHYGNNMPILAEDLGFITEEVWSLMREFDLPGMKILQFAFDAKEAGDMNPGNIFLPHHYNYNSIVYTGTHDNEPLASRIANMKDFELDYMYDYLGHFPEDRVHALIVEAMKSVAGMAIFPIQDILQLGPESRMNTPSTIADNWAWRLLPGQLTETQAKELEKLTWRYGRRKAGSS